MADISQLVSQQLHCRLVHHGSPTAVGEDWSADSTAQHADSLGRLDALPSGRILGGSGPAADWRPPVSGGLRRANEVPWVYDGEHVGDGIDRRVAGRPDPPSVDTFAHILNLAEIPAIPGPEHRFDNVALRAIDDKLQICSVIIIDPDRELNLVSCQCCVRDIDGELALASSTAALYCRQPAEELLEHAASVDEGAVALGLPESPGIVLPLRGDGRDSRHGAIAGTADRAMGSLRSDAARTQCCKLMRGLTVTIDHMKRAAAASRTGRDILVKRFPQQNGGLLHVGDWHSRDRDPDGG